MRYYTEIDAVEELESVDMTDGIMLTGEDCLMRTEDQRLLVQSLLLDPPAAENDERLQMLEQRQTILWLEKIEGCASMQLCIRLPDRPVDAFLPHTGPEIERLSGYMARPVDEVRSLVQAARNLNPDLSCRGCRMMISNELPVPRAHPRDFVRGPAARHPQAVLPAALCLRMPRGFLSQGDYHRLCRGGRHRMYHRHRNRHAPRSLHRRRACGADGRDGVQHRGARAAALRHVPL